MITSVDNVRVKEVVRLRRSRERRARGLFVVEGMRELERARAAGLRVRAVYAAPELLGASDATVAPADPAPPDLVGARPAAAAPTADAEAAPADAEAEVRAASLDGAEEVSARVLRHMSYRAEPEGVLAVVEAPERELPANATLVLVAVGVEKPGNLGAMARSADAAGADALLVADGVFDPWNPNAIRASTGAVFTLPILPTTLAEVPALPLQRVAAVVGAPQPYTDADLRSPTALLVGAEAEGLSDEWRAVADHVISIPMAGRATDSLNASVAAAILLFEAVRQRR